MARTITGFMDGSHGQQELLRLGASLPEHLRPCDQDFLWRPRQDSNLRRTV
jgi:hypothetical protein